MVGGAGGGGTGDGDERNGNNFYERFHVNQYYNAVEDEQIYMDEYTTLFHRYNDFITNGNTMFSRMEQTLRDNLSRSLVRQTFYYQRFDELRSIRGYERRRHIPIPLARPPPDQVPVAPSTPVAQVASERTTASPAASRFGDVFNRLISNYVNTDIAREERRNNNPVSLLYTFPIDLATLTGAGAGAGAANRSNTNTTAPTNDQINRATLSTVFSHIISPVNATCPISRDEFSDESEITMIRGCNHIFNRASLREWFVSHSSCPMCRSDIREYRPPSSSSSSSSSSRPLSPPQLPSNPPQPVVSSELRSPANLSIDSVDENHVTFSYDLPMNYNNDQIYQDILNTVNDMTTTNHNHNHNHNQYHYHDHDDDDDDDDDILEVD